MTKVSEIDEEAEDGMRVVQGKKKPPGFRRFPGSASVLLGLYAGLSSAGAVREPKVKAEEEGRTMHSDEM
ncbi:MAG: hypothetical protein IPG57_07210 [Burkholderiales bacterium]|jgi:hypothetical protein|nr:hypothetical protein [Burkholderiales bacterium]MBP7519768.1 hypothetical protein [Leptothrix sp. (in: b-proteobacteria)]